MTVHVFVSTGQGGKVTCPATVSLNGRIASLAGVVAPGPFEWFQIETIAELVKKVPDKDKIVVGGTSLGANEAPRIAAMVAPRRIAYLFGIQPSKLGERNLIPSNVSVARTWRCPWYWPFSSAGLGMYQWELKPSNSITKLYVENTLAIHPGDYVESIQQTILADIANLARISNDRRS